MAITAIDRFTSPSIYAPALGVSRGRAPDEAGTIDRSAAAPRPAPPVEAGPPAAESLTSSARAAAVALAAAPREATASVAGAREAADDAADAALDALADPLDPPTPQQVAENFAVVAALVPSPQQLANDAVAPSGGADQAVLAPGIAAGDRDARDPRAGAGETFGPRLSRFA